MPSSYSPAFLTSFSGGSSSSGPGYTQYFCDKTSLSLGRSMRFTLVRPLTIGSADPTEFLKHTALFKRLPLRALACDF